MKKDNLLNRKINFLLVIMLLIKALLIIGMEGLSIYFVNYLVASNFKMFLILGASIIIAYFLQLGFSYFIDVYKLKFVEDNIVNFKQNLLKMIMSQEPCNIKDADNYVSWFVNDASSLKSLYYNSIYSLYYNVFVAISGLLFLVNIHYVLAISALLVTSITMLVPKIYVAKVNKADLTLTKDKENFNRKFTNLLTGFKQMYFNNKEKNLKKPTFLQFDEITSARIKNKKIRANYGSISYSIRILTDILLYSVTVALIVMKFINVGVLITISQIVQKISGGVIGLMKDYANIKSAKAILEKYDTEIMLTTQNNKKEIDSINTIGFKNVTINFGDNLVIDNFSQEFIKNKKYAIVGESGSGKSTIIKSILGLVPEYEGSISINDVDIKDINKHSLFERIGFVDSDNFIFNSDINENIALDLDINEDSKKMKLSQIIDTLNLNSIDSETELSKDCISTGQIQRINLARMWYFDKSFVILDEATANLDIENRTNIENKLLQREDLTVIFITHHLSEALRQKFDYIIDIDKKIVTSV